MPSPSRSHTDTLRRYLDWRLEDTPRTSAEAEVDFALDAVLADLQRLEAIADEAQRIAKRLYDARKWHADRDDREAVRQLDFAIGATLSLRSALEDSDV